MVYSLRIVASQRDQNYVSLSKIQGGGSVDGALVLYDDQGSKRLII